MSRPTLGLERDAKDSMRCTHPTPKVIVTFGQAGLVMLAATYIGKVAKSSTNG
jgi:hypothetical protein